MGQRIVVIASALTALMHCSGQTTVGSNPGGSDASRSSSGGSSGGSSSGGPSSGATSGGGSGGTSSGESSGSGTSSGGTSSGSAGPDSGSDGGCLPPADGGPRATTPPPNQRRAQATACAPSAAHTSCGATDGGGQSCTTGADCTQDGGAYSPYSYCLHGQCGLDQCLTDSDCSTTQVCSCSSAYYGGNGCYHPNVCVPADCHVDSDCGPGGFCSPTAGYCGVVEGFYCHKATDACFDPRIDCSCAGPVNGGACVHAPTTGAWVCGSAICSG